MDLRELANAYIGINDFDDVYADHLRRTARRLSDYCGRSITCLNYDSINAWLDDELDRNSSTTASNYRRMLITLLNFGADLDGWDVPRTRKIKRIKCRLPAPSALHPNQIPVLLEACSKLTGDYGGNSRADYWRAVIVGGYDIGARRYDMLRTLTRSIVDGREFSFVCHKEGVVHCRQLSPLGCELLGKLSPHSLAYPWIRSKSAWNKTVRAIGKLAGISWQFKQLRKTHGTLAGTLGHRNERVFRDYYFDPSIVAGSATAPPPIAALVR